MKWQKASRANGKGITSSRVRLCATKPERNVSEKLNACKSNRAFSFSSTKATFVVRTKQCRYSARSRYIIYGHTHIRLLLFRHIACVVFFAKYTVPKPTLITWLANRPPAAEYLTVVCNIKCTPARDSHPFPLPSDLGNHSAHRRKL